MPALNSTVASQTLRLCRHHAPQQIPICRGSQPQELPFKQVPPTIGPNWPAGDMGGGACEVVLREVRNKGRTLALSLSREYPAQCVRHDFLKCVVAASTKCRATLSAARRAV